MAIIIRSLELPEPEREYRFMPRCCGHLKRRHLSGDSGVQWCVGCLTDGVARGADHVHAFEPGRKFRFDFAWPDRRLAVEADGGTWTGGRHTRGGGYEKDCIKLNQAALRGWAVLRFTEGMIEDGTARETLEQAFS